MKIFDICNNIRNKGDTCLRVESDQLNMGSIKAKKEIVYTCNASQTSLNMKFSNFLSDNFDYSTDSPEVRKIYPKTYFPLAGSIDITFREVMVEVLVHYTYAMPHLKFIENPEIHKKEYKFVKFKKD